MQSGPRFPLTVPEYLAVPEYSLRNTLTRALGSCMMDQISRDRKVNTGRLQITRFQLRACGEPTTGVLDGRDHIVIPVTAYVRNAVTKGLFADGPEFAPVKVMAEFIEQWNGRPIVTDHNVSDGAALSANNADFLNSHKFGTIFNPSISDEGHLVLDAWIDMSKGDLSDDSKWAIDRLKSGDNVELSIAGWTRIVEEDGESPDGVAYEYKWTEFMPDHLAIFGPEGVGACSNDMGCGVRNLRSLATSIASKIKSLLGITSNDLELQLGHLLEDRFPEFNWIISLYPDDSQVVYSTSLGNNYRSFRIGYTVDGREVSLDGDPVEVETDFVDLSGSNPHSLGSTASAISSEPLTEPKEGKGTTMDKDLSEALEGLSSLVQSIANRLPGPQEPGDSAKSDDAGCSCLSSLKPEQEVGDGLVVVLSSELSDLRLRAEQEKKREQQKRDELVAILSGKTAFDDDGLGELSLNQLTHLAATVQNPPDNGGGNDDDTAPLPLGSDDLDFTGRGLPVSSDGGVPKAPSMKQMLAGRNS